jgi:16S rRNA (guanine(966)-N(2))-methyltransferase RsmD
MRVIGGKFRSRPLLAPAGLDTRPTSDRLRETLFNVLTQGAVNRVAGSAFLDLYAGSGAVGIEALSLGADSVTFVEQAAAALAVLQKNLDGLGLRRPQVQVEKRSVRRFLGGAPEKAAFGVVFLDPPYEMAEEYEATLGLLGSECARLLAPEAVVVAEHRRKSALQASYGKLVRTRVLEQGDAGLSLYSIG